MSFTANIFKDSAVYALPGICSRAIGLLLIPLYTRILTPSEYGILDLFIIVGSLVNLTIALEISQGVARLYIDAKTEASKVLYASTGLWFSVAAYLAFTIIAFLFSDKLAFFITGVNGYKHALQLSIAYFALNGLFLFLQNQFRWELKSKQYAVISMIMICVTALSAFLFAYIFGLGLHGILIGMIIGVLSASIYGCYGLWNSFSFTFKTTYLQELLAFSLPLVPASICVFVSSFVDRIMINSFMDLEDVGLYGVAFRLASVVGLLMIGFQGAITPLVYKHFKDDGFANEFASIFRYFSAMALLLVLTLGIFAYEALIILTAPAFYEASSLVFYLAPAILFSGMYIFAPGIGIKKKTKLILWINIVGAVLNLCLNYVLIPLLGVQGAALATLTGNFLVFVLYMYCSQRLYRIPHQWILGAIGMGLILALSYVGSNIESGFYSIFLKLGLLVIGFTALCALRIIRKEELFYMFHFLKFSFSNVVKK